MKALVTGNLGFIGSNLTIELAGRGHQVIGIDACKFQANPGWLLDRLMEKKTLERVTQYHERLDSQSTYEIVKKEMPDVIFNLAAESHVDNCQSDPTEAMMSNYFATHVLLEAVRQIPGYKPRIVHVSTDEVFGELNEKEAPFSTKTGYAPRSVYAATKAASDHLVRAYGITYGMDVVVTNCSNNYGPNQYPEKLIPRILAFITSNQSVRVNGNGKQVRDWIYVNDHCLGLIVAAEKGTKGSTYLFGGGNEKTNLDMIYSVYEALKRCSNEKFEFGFIHTQDRPHDDFRYAIDFSKTTEELGWKPSPVEIFDDLLCLTVSSILKQMRDKNHYSIENALFILGQGSVNSIQIPRTAAN